MIRVSLYISKYDWVVHCYFAVSCYYVYEILDVMKRVGAADKYLSKAYISLFDCKLNGGITYSNYTKRESVLVTELTSCASEFFDSILHETGHLATDIAIEEGLDLKGEEVRYIQGDIGRALFPYCKKLLCDCCRNND